MSNTDFLAELHREYDWRFDEVRRLKNLIEGEKAALRDDLRKSLILLLYAHFEGYCVFSLQHYLTAVNTKRLACRTVNPALVAGAWNRLFQAMESGDHKCKVFKQKLPDDHRLHRHWRRRHFVERIDESYREQVELSEDIIDAESNLKPEVLSRNLFVLGLDHTFVTPHAETISNLLGKRNRLAHGEDRRGVPEREYEEYELSVFAICFKLIDFLEDAYRESSYERAVPSYPC